MFTAVTAEVGQLLEVDITVLVRYDPDDAITTVGTWTSRGAEAPTAVGTRLPVGGRNVATLVVRTTRPARIDYADASGADASGPTVGTVALLTTKTPRGRSGAWGRA